MNEKKDIKKVLILGTDNTSLSIIAEAVLNRYLKSVQAYSAGIDAGNKIDENTQRLLKENALWSDDLKPKQIKTLESLTFDLVITLSEYAMKKSPSFCDTTDIIAIEYDSLEGKNYSEYKKSLKLMQMEITPIVRMHFEL